jgi:glutamate N-acetyltransferase / amino-acid N-acetyltransferase
MKQKICQGFKLSGVTAGLYNNEKKDVGLILSTVPANAAGLFTKNRVKAAPVLIDLDRIKSGICRAVIVNSGNANCCTGDQGIEHAHAMTQYAASELNIPEQQVLVASTGVIGEPLQIEKIENAVPLLVKSLSDKGVSDFAQAIMTTDTAPKIVTRYGDFNGKRFTVTGVAKGSGMMKPDMATMLCFLLTDIQMPSDILKQVLITGADRSLNRITIDGDTSTNDTVLLLANGLSEVSINSSSQAESFQTVIDQALLELAKQLVRDGEGATKFVEVIVRGAKSDKDARCIADTIADSSLVKTAFFGEDANWGRILCAAGRAGVEIQPESVDLFFDDVQMVKQGVGCGKHAESKATDVLKKQEFNVTVNLNMGKGCASVLTCDFSLDYVNINADYRS